MTVAPTLRVGPRPVDEGEAGLGEAPPVGPARAWAVEAASAAKAGHLSVAPYGLAGSVAARTATSDPSPSLASGPALSRSERSKSRAPGSANCVAPSPATKYPRRRRPLSSSAFNTGYIRLKPP